MEPHKIDKIFRERAASFEAKPSSGAWDQISGKIQNKGTNGAFRKVAAAIVLIAGASLWLLDTARQNEGASIATISHPVEREPFTFDWNLSVKEHSLVNETQVVESGASTGTSAGNPAIGKNEKVELIAFEEYSTTPFSPTKIEIRPFTDYDRLAAKLQTSSAQIIKRNTVNIKYIASNEEEIQEGTFKKIVNYARSNTPIEMLSDIREVKNEFISSKISLD